MTLPSPRISIRSSAGCLHWLREYPGAARVVATIAELVTDLGLIDEPDDAPPPDGSGDLRNPIPGRPARPKLEAVLVELGPTARDIGAALVSGRGSLDELVAATGLEPATVLGALTVLELHGFATTTYGRYRAAGQLAAVTPGEIGERTARRLPARPGPC